MVADPLPAQKPFPSLLSRPTDRDFLPGRAIGGRPFVFKTSSLPLALVNTLSGSAGGRKQSIIGGRAARGGGLPVTRECRRAAARLRWREGVRPLNKECWPLGFGLCFIVDRRTERMNFDLIKRK